MGDAFRKPARLRALLELRLIPDAFAQGIHRHPKRSGQNRNREEHLDKRNATLCW